MSVHITIGHQAELVLTPANQLAIVKHPNVSRIRQEMVIGPLSNKLINDMIYALEQMRTLA